jgi:hypothetical protein
VTSEPTHKISTNPSKFFQQKLKKEQSFRIQKGDKKLTTKKKKKKGDKEYAYD